MTLTRAEAITKFRQVTRRYGLQWTTGVPRAAYDELAKCDKVLTTNDRREALGLQR